MSDVSQILVALFTLAIIAVLAGNKKTPAFITAVGSFLTASVQKVTSA